jgi:hypothetical protein
MDRTTEFNFRYELMNSSIKTAQPKSGVQAQFDFIQRPSSNNQKVNSNG